MTKEELLNKASKLAEVSARGTDAYRDMLDFFESNVCIPKGKRRHKDAEALHEWVEGAKIEKCPNGGTWCSTAGVNQHFDGSIRIKPSEPIYEWQYCHENHVGKNSVSDKYYTDHEYETMVDDKERCIKLPWTKKERK